MRPVTVNGDRTVELDEYFFIALSNPVNAEIAQSQGQVTIQNDDVASISINDISQLEGDGGGLTIFTFTATLDNAVDTEVNVEFLKQNITTTDLDLQTANGNFKFTGLAGETQVVNINVIADDIVELDESFFINLTSIEAGGRSVSFADNQGLGVIENDDTATIIINDISQLEGSGGGNSNFAFTATLGSAVDVSLSLDFVTADNIATTSDNDYTAVNRSLIFKGSAGETQNLNINVIADDRVEPDESFFVILANLQANGRAVTIADAQGLATILTDDTNRPPTANPGGTQTVLVGDTVSLNGSSSSDLDGDTLTYRWLLTAPNGINTTLSNPNTVKPNFVADMEGTYTVQLIVNDGLVDSEPGITTITARVLPKITLSTSKRLANETGLAPGIFLVSRTESTANPLTVFYNIAGSAINGADYQLLSGSVVIPTGSSSAEIVISPIDDTENEGSENVILGIKSDSKE